MVRIRIPQTRQAALLTLSRYSDELVDEIYTIFDSIAPGQYDSELPDLIAPRITNKGDAIDIRDVLDTLFSLYPLIIRSGKSADQVVDDIVTSLANDASGQSDLSDQEQQQLHLNLKKLLNVPNVGLGAKATDVLYNNERNFVNSRILSDIRPVFRLDSTEIGGAVVMHTFKLEYMDSSDGNKEFYVVIDSDDIESIILTLQRAQEKEKKIKDMLNASGVPLIWEDK